MKKYFLSLVAIAAAMLFATSCQESLVEPQVGGPTTFSVQLPEQMGTKAIGDALSVTELLVDVYAQNGTAPIYQTKGTPNGNGFDVQLNLIQDQAYDILFWAQTGNGYVEVTTTDGKPSFGSLRSVPMNANFLNNDNGAAFFHAEKGFVPNGTSKNITLVRPFAQLNLGTTAESLTTDAGTFELVSSSVKVTGMANKFNVFEGFGFDETVATYDYGTQDVPADEDLNVTGVSNLNYVSMNYLAVLGNEKALVDVEASIVVMNKTTNETQTINHTFTNVPVQENYRTNIVGNLISSTTDFIVKVDNAFAKDENENIVDNKYVVVDDVAAANNALAAGETYIAVNYITGEQTINLSNNASADVFYLQIPEADATLTIEGDNATEVFVHVLNNTAIDAVAKLIINTPNGTVTVTGPGVKLSSIEATTASNTLILDGVKVAEVVIEQGNVLAVNDTEVKSLKRSGTNDDTNTVVTVDETSEVIIANDQEDKDKIQVLGEGVSIDENGAYLISSAKGLKWFADNIKGQDGFAGKTVKLTENIDLTGVTTDGDSFGPIGRYCSGQGVNAPFKGHFDGQGHTIKGIYQSGWDFGYEWGTTGYLGLFGYVKDATIEDLTIEGMESVVEGGTLAAIAGRADGECTFKNITVKNTKLGTYNNRCGGIVGWTGGYYKDEAETEVACHFTFENINICEDVVLGGLWGSFDSSIGGIMGQLNSAGSASFKNVTVSCRIDAYNDCTASYDYYLYRMCGMLIGQMTKTTTIDGSTYPDVAAYGIEFDNVTVNYGQWMNYHYCEPTPGLNGGRGMRVEAGFTYDGLPADYDHTQCVDNHYNCIPFDQLFGGVQTACKGVKAWEGVIVNYPEEYTCPLCGEQHNVD